MTEVCARGCTVARRHGPDCDQTVCQGCQPRTATAGLLCDPCHTTLAGWLRDAPGQHTLLELAQHPTLEQQLRDINPTGDIDAPAPLNLDAVTIGLYLTDVLSGWVEMLATQYQMSGPEPLQTMAGRQMTPRWSHYAGETVWVDPPPLFTIKAACTWLTAQQDRLEYCPGIGDLWEELRDVMARAHAVAPWREEVAALRGVECPSCHAFALVHKGGSEDVVCTRCNETIPPARYQIWTRILVAERTKEDDAANDR